MKNVALLLLLFSLVACATSGVKTSNENLENSNIDSQKTEKRSLYYNKCISRNKRKGYIDLNEKCICLENQFLNTDNSYIDQAKACSHLGVKPGDVIVSPKDLCESYQKKSKLAKGDIVVQNRVFNKGVFEKGVKTSRSDLIWNVIDINNDGIYLRLEKGKYYSKKIGEIVKFANTGNYRRLHPKAPLWDQFTQEHHICVNPKL